MTDNFFDEAKEQFVAKANIVSKYFWAWAKAIIGVQKNYSKPPKIAYIDLFAGPGRKAGKLSTPLLVLQQAIENNDIRESLITIFNDKNEEYTRTLDKEIKNFPNINSLKYKPIIYNEEILAGSEIVKIFEEMKLIPTLLFADPWGYKGLSLRLINSVLKNWGCDCIFFFNYNRINPGLNNSKVKEHMDALFGEEHADKLRIKLNGLSSEEREFAIVEEIGKSLKNMGGKYVLPFRFKNERGTRTSHHLIFVSKDPLGYKIMKDIMAKESSDASQGVPSFEYNPASRKYPLLFELSRPLDELAELLLSEYAGCELTVKAIFESHNVGRRYILKNYQDVLKKLALEGKIKCNPPIDRGDSYSLFDEYSPELYKDRKTTMPEKTLIIFPQRFIKSL